MNKQYSIALLGAALIGTVVPAFAQTPFPAVDTNFTGNTVVVPPSPYQYKVMFREGESMVETKSGETALARGSHDFTGFIPKDGKSDEAYIIVNHELRDSSSIFGDGGGMTVFEVKKSGTEWNVVGPYRNVDFSEVGGTWVNCGGAHTPHGTVLTAEEYPPQSNAEMYSGGRQIRDTNDVTVMFNGEAHTIHAYQNYGWMVEVDPVQGKALRKLHKLGNFSHEGGYCMADGKTIYLTDDNSPAVFFKFVATTPNDYTDGQLYAFKQSADGASGEWLTLPMELDSLLDIRNVAIRMGATLFIRHEWITQANGKMYLTETGLDNFQFGKEMAMGGTPAHHLQQLVATSDTSFVDYYGRVLEFDPATNRIRVYLNGGAGQRDRTIHFSNPDGLTTAHIKGKDYLVINEDLNGYTMGRVSIDARKAQRYIPEVYFLDASIENPTTDDLERFLVGPAGSETTGGVFSADYQTYFVNIQHPSSSNPAPFNKSATIAVRGFDPGAAGRDDDYGDSRTSGFDVYPNPATRVLRFNRAEDVAMYNAQGERILTQRNANRIDISSLTPGVYYLQTIKGDVKKVVVQ